MDAAEAYGLLVKNQTASLPLKNVSVSSFVQGYLLGIQSILKYKIRALIQWKFCSELPLTTRTPWWDWRQ